MITRPMLAATIKFDGTEPELDYPMYVSPKLDGIRCMIHPEHGVVSRNFKPIRNKWVQTLFNNDIDMGMDGELMLKEGGDFNAVQSAVMSAEGTPNVIFRAFDNFTHPELPWTERFFNVKSSGLVFPIRHRQVNSWEEILEYEENYIKAGHEGIMIRHPLRPYKQGRSTLREQGLMKLKRFMDADGYVFGFEERMHNANEATVGIQGGTERSSHKENMQPAGTLGTLLINTLDWGVVRVGTGFTDAERLEIWNNQASYVGKEATFKYEPVLKDKPRFPVFLNWRE